MDATLLEHYKNTDYWFVVDDRKITLSVGDISSDFNSLCHDVNCKTGAFITAFNPHSSLLSTHENRHRNLLLEADISNLKGIRYFYGAGEDRDNQWLAEESFMVLGLSQQTVIDLARRYQQNAFLWIEHQQAAVLIDV
ncbi:hypothetical protein CEW91_04690 [Idiomarina piscisalsi]|uniref:DUF3293 domain-containing protein n=1 Tax=Idiomarina piscisalsi TaxID=1096243 RepID=A0ABM6LSF5_9GAMM|nr:DUF3293 domain-containing protein [Idiomarina piscisalsi]ASG65472.1 hypothetical protein CEW91_04690 [Idiomarina piscisalsi]